MNNIDIQETKKQDVFFIYVYFLYFDVRISPRGYDMRLNIHASTNVLKTANDFFF